MSLTDIPIEGVLMAGLLEEGGSTIVLQCPMPMCDELITITRLDDGETTSQSLRTQHGDNPEHCIVVNFESEEEADAEGFRTEDWFAAIHAHR